MMDLIRGLVCAPVYWNWCGESAVPAVGACGRTPESPSTVVDGLVRVVQLRCGRWRLPGPGADGPDGGPTPAGGASGGGAPQEALVFAGTVGH